MQPSSKRVKGIFSVIASPNRLEILRILNTRGPLSYSDLKMMAGFKSKKESGKFAYHLRKLVRVALVSLNRSERKYIVTNLGRLVLNQARQLEEQSMLESGRLYVRTSRQMMEEFNADRILQSLVRESGMPMDLAQRITSEAEQRLHKFQTNYLTGPLIRELVNALLIEQGLEEYRHKLTRLGLPVYDVTQLVDKAGESGQGVGALIETTARAVLSEYLLLARLPKDVADAHLNGDIHIARAGVWGLKPDNIFVDAATLADFSLKGRVLQAPRLKPAEDLDGALSHFANASLLISREAAVEACFEGLAPYLAKYSNGSGEDLRRSLRRTLFEMGVAASRHGDDGFITLVAKNSGEEDERRIVDVLIGAYGDYVEATPNPMIKLVYHDVDGGSKQQLPEGLVNLVAQGVDIAVCRGPRARSYIGLAKNILPAEISSGFSSVHSLSVNLPRLSYESSKDDTYFKAKLAMQLNIAVQALDNRRRMMNESTKKGLLPTLSSNPSIVTMETMPLFVNLIGLDDALAQLAGDKATGSTRNKMVEGIVQTALKVSADRGLKIGETIGVSILEDDSASRFAAIDADRYGKLGSGPTGGKHYSHGAVLSSEDLDDAETVERVSMLSTKLNGGFHASFTPDKGEALAELMAKANKHLSYYRVQPKQSICKNCGAKMIGYVGRCRNCRSMSLIHAPMPEN
ncbi:MAG: helix-turn-helix domain-containing protein [Thaumarchaeota archaeon]|nr:helix-turn-helix domain-containing protein [Nitrososphaerota archaeon]